MMAYGYNPAKAGELLRGQGQPGVCSAFSAHSRLWCRTLLQEEEEQTKKQKEKKRKKKDQNQHGRESETV